MNISKPQGSCLNSINSIRTISSINRTTHAHEVNRHNCKVTHPDYNSSRRLLFSKITLKLSLDHIFFDTTRWNSNSTHSVMQATEVVKGYKIHVV